MTGLRARFAKNLRRLSSGAESYAAVARAVGINRQQFNDYLTGNNLPNETIIKKLCKHFGVDLSEFFLIEAATQKQYSFDQIDAKSSNFLLSFIKAHSQKQEYLPKSGLYYIYFLVPNEKDLIVCSLLAIDNQAGLCKFRRITRLTGEQFFLRPKKYSVHAGFMTYSKEEIFMFGANILDEFTPSVMMCRPVVSKDILFHGMAFVNAPSAFAITDFVILKPQGNLAPREALRNVKLHRSDSTELCQAAVRYLLGL
jgi:transcriptional regulator with XRE-family HTH domain